jgi:hypothetical protein
MNFRDWFPGREADVDVEEVRQRLEGGETVVMTHRGAGMRPLLRDGDAVAVGPVDRPIRRGQVVVIAGRNRLRVERIRDLEDGRCVARGDVRALGRTVVPVTDIVGRAHYCIRPGGMHVPLLTSRLAATLWLAVLPMVRLIVWTFGRGRRRRDGDTNESDILS